MGKRIVTVNDKMQKGYRYTRTAPAGRGFDPEFKPQLTPAQMLKLGVFAGKYMTDCKREFPKSWFASAKLSPRQRDVSINCFGVDASQPLSEWRRKGWIHPHDPRCWFQWYCRYYSGRRMPDEDRRQIGRWKAIRRHVRQIQKNCEPGDVFCQPWQRHGVAALGVRQPQDLNSNSIQQIRQHLRTSYVRIVAGVDRIMAPALTLSALVELPEAVVRGIAAAIVIVPR
jgi:hypothetical protein